MKTTVSVGQVLYSEGLDFAGGIGQGNADPSPDVDYELIYLGQDGQRFFIGHREHDNGTARSEYSLTYTFESPPRGQSTTVVIRERTFVVHEATNAGLHFENMQHGIKVGIEGEAMIAKALAKKPPQKTDNTASPKSRRW